jgi:integrase
MPTSLTPTAVHAAIKAACATGRGRVLNDTEPGLNLRVGVRVATWTWLGHDAHGRVRRFGLGRYPHIGLAEARRRARAMADEVRRGADPVAAARARRASLNAPTGHTLAQLLDLYGRQVGNDVKSWSTQMDPQVRRVFGTHLDTPLASLSVGALQMTIDRHPKPKSAAFARSCLMPMLRWAAAPGRAYVDRALLDLRASAQKPVRDRVLSRDELRALLPVLRAPGDVYADALRLILLSAVRRGELAAARWKDIDFTARTWTLPETKNGQPHVVPLPWQALALLQARMPPDPDPAAFVFTKTNGKALDNWEDATKRIQAMSGTGGWTRHDLRRSAATLMGELGVMPAVVEASLNHVTIHSRIAAVYNKSRYRPQVADALQQLANRLDAIEHGGGDIVALRAG